MHPGGMPARGEIDEGERACAGTPSRGCSLFFPCTRGSPLRCDTPATVWQASGLLAYYHLSLRIEFAIGLQCSVLVKNSVLKTF